MVRTAVAAARAALLVVTGYLAILTVAAVRAASRKSAGQGDGAPTRRFAVLIPAHNEQQLIGSTLASVADLDYPAGLVETHVVADNCTDRTADIVRASAAEVHERADPEHAGKGPALRWLIGRLLERDERPDAFVFIDADTTVDEEFLRVVDRHLADGTQVVQGHYAVRDAGDSPVVAFRAAAMAARTFLRPLGRTAIGGSAGLHGNGMVFTTAVAQGRRWSDHLTEDVEAHLDLLLDGTLIDFAPGARIEAEMPASLEAARSQHERWERGRLELARRYVPLLVKRAVTGGPAGRLAYADAAMDQAVPPLSVVAAATAGWNAVALVRLLLGERRAVTELAVGSFAAISLAAHVFAALRLTAAPWSTYRALLQAPRMGVWKFGLWSRVLFGRRRVAWTRTERN